MYYYFWRGDHDSVFFFLVLLFSTGCFTAKYHQYNVKKFHVRKEFVRPSGGRQKVFKGSVTPRVRVGDVLYHELSIPGVLAGGGRNLVMRVPVSERERQVRFKEYQQEPTSRGSGGLAYLVLNMSSSVRHLLFALGKGQKKMDPKTFLSYLGQTVEKIEYPTVVCSLGLSSRDRYDLRCITFSLWEGRPIVTAFHQNARTDNYDHHMEDLKWVRRSSGRLILHLMGYLGTLAVDIVTLPVQLVVFPFYMVITKNY